MCVTLSSSREVNDPDKDVGEVVASCDLYLMDTAIPNLLLPNKRYRTIDPKLKNILGSSDVEAKLSTKFRYAYVEVLPLPGKKYIDDAITLPATKLAGQKLGYVIEVNKNLLMTMPTSINTSAPLPIPNGINRDYMDWLRDEQKQDPWPEYNKATTSPYEYSITRIKAYGINVEPSQVKSVEVSGSSSVPINATLIDVNDLMSNFNAGANKTDYTFVNFLEKSPLTTDQDISDTFMHHINNGHLPSQYYYVLGHGNTFAFAGYDNQTGAAVYYDCQIGSLIQLFAKLKINGYTFDKTLIFLACHLGNGVGSFAELFSALPDVGTVYAFTGFGWFGSRRPFNCGPGYLVSYEENAVNGTSVVGAIKRQLYSSTDLKGHWRIFNAATAVIKS